MWVMWLVVVIKAKLFVFDSAGAKYEPVLVDNAYKVHMKLTIRAVVAADYGSYKCVSKNSLGETDGTIKLYRKYWHTSKAIAQNVVT